VSAQAIGATTTGWRAIGRELMRYRAALGLGLVCVVFQAATGNFLSPFNVTNLLLQVAAVGVISIGVVFVLLVGEIDLSVGVVSAFTAACMGSLIARQGVEPIVAMGLAVLIGGTIGVAQGSIVTRLGLPSFVVTLSGLLIWQGALVWVLGISGSVSVSAPAVVNLTRTFLPPAAGWILAGAVVVGMLAVVLRSGRDGGRRGRAAARIVPVLAVSALTLALVWTLNQDRGVPVALVILVGAVLVFQYVATRTRYGRHVFAVGGNTPAARRSGIRVELIRTSVFALAGALSACGGILAASRLLSVGTTSGGSDLLLLALAGPIIAGTSMFGGRGSVWSALLGALLIGAISNGMDLLAFEPYAKSIITGAVLLAAVALDVVSRRYGGAR
jgi:D-xylose transport system permease protein